VGAINLILPDRTENEQASDLVGEELNAPDIEYVSYIYTSLYNVSMCFLFDSSMLDMHMT
jgi:hypothetical protein